MSRYIDADKLLNPDNIIVMQDETGIDEFPYTYTNAVKVETILNSPTADVVEVVHASWKYGKVFGQPGYYCTKCSAGFTGENAEWIAKEHNYCPKCGAKMDGERREE